MCQSTHPSNFRRCLVCEKKLIGRSDKIFCDIHCKNYYHSEIRKSTRSFTNETIRFLKRNYVILEGFMTDKANKFSIHKTKLEREGFKFQYVTHFVENKNFTQFSLFNFDYCLGKNNRIVVRRKQQNATISPFLFKRWLNDLPLKNVA